jgi:hypothetical protein
MGQSLFFLKYGCHPNLPTTVHVSGIENPTTEEFVESLGWARDVAGSALLHAAEMMKRFMDRKRKEAPRFTPGESVWLDLRNISTSCPSKKLDAHCTGPFEVIEGFLGTHPPLLLTTFTFPLVGRSTPFSTSRYFSQPMKGQTCTQWIKIQIYGHHWMSLRKSKSMRSKESWITREGRGNKNIWLSGRDIQCQR